MISLLSYKLRKNELTINWDKIWKEQEIEQGLLTWMDDLGEKVHMRLLNPPDGNTNIGTYCKKKICWERVQSLANNYTEVPSLETFVSLNKEKEQSSQGRQKAKLDSGINSQVRVLELSRTQTPKKLVEFYNSPYAPGITDLNRGVIKSWHEGKIMYPSEKQAKIILEVINKAIDSGFTGVK